MSKDIFEGDLVFFRSSGKWYEQLVCLVTHGPFCHVGIAIDSLHVLAANPGGIAVGPLPTSPDAYAVLPLSTSLPLEQIEIGLAWAKQQEGKQYGWTDIVYQGVKFLFPNNPFQLTEADHWDCSDFATRYLQEAGVTLPDAYSDPYKNTPNDLARWAGLIK